MKKITLLLAGCALLLSGCTGVKSSFDCDATTSDTCMTMTKANQLARDKAAKQSGKPAAGGLPSLVNIPAPAPAPASVASRPMVPSPAVKRAPASASSEAHLVPPGTVVRSLTPVVEVPLSCQNVRCDSPGMAHPQRTADRVATVWIAPWMDSDNAFHQPGRVSFVVTPSDWVLPSRVN